MREFPEEFRMAPRREEGELIPMGTSVTETLASWVIHNRTSRDEYTRRRIPKDDAIPESFEVCRREDD